MSEALFSARALSFAYGGHPVLDDVTLDIFPGELVGVIGPNGAGKSTLLRVLAGSLAPGKGSVRFLGDALKEGDPRALARKIAMLPQSLDTPFPYSVEEFVTMGRYPYSEGRFSYGDEDRRIVAMTLEMLDLNHLSGRPVNALSEGERQKVYLAQCIVQEPRALLLDEPVSHLDIRHQLRTMEWLDELHGEGLTVVMVLHDLNLAAEFCSRIVLLSGGRVFADGTPEETLTYGNIEAVYETVVVVRRNPYSGKPFIVPVSKKYLTLSYP
jgi:iron complex transport system ATP-binding protein